MRLVEVSAPVGNGARIAQLGLDVGIASVSVHQVFVHGPDERRDVADIQTSTPLAHAFIEALLDAPFYDSSTFTIETREPRSILGREAIAGLSWPMPLPKIDVLVDLWEFTHVTPSLVIRVFVAALLLATGMIRDQLLLMAGGLLFLPLLPGLMAIAFGLRCRDFPLARQGVAMLCVATGLMIVAGALAAILTGEPLGFQQFGTPLTGVALSLVVGLAATAGVVDDTGRRELIGLAAASQMALVPVWFGISLVQGFPSTSTLVERVGSYGLNGAVIVLAVVAGHFIFYARNYKGERSRGSPVGKQALEKAS